MITDFASVVSIFSTGTYTVTRSGTASYTSDGRLQPAAETTFTIDASVQAAPARVLDDTRPEGLQSSASFAVFTVTELRTTDSGQLPDVVTIGGRDFQVMTVVDWATLGGYWQYLVTEV